MKLYDVVWGKTEILDKDVIKIIEHPAMQRIKNVWISTYGYLYELKRNATRFDHSVGVYLLLKHFKASKKEQLAGLIHDISHTALSHVSTYAMYGKYTGKEFHEIQHHKLIEESGLGDLIYRLGYDVNELLDEKKYSLLENNLPDICADRLDYALRDGLHLQCLSRQQIEKILKGLKVIDNEFIFTDIDAAFTYSFNFYLLNMLHYGSPMEAYFNNNFGNLFKYAIKKKVLSEKDWFSDDVKVVEKLQKSRNKKIREWLDKFNNKLVVFEDRNNPDNILTKKIRIIDPKILVRNEAGASFSPKKFKRLSELSQTYKTLIEEYKKTHAKHELPVKAAYKSF